MREATILIVEDDPDTRRMLRTHLEREDFTVLAEHDGLAALEVERASRPDLVVLDITLPDSRSQTGTPIDGIEVLRRLRQASDVFVLMLTVTSAEIVKVLALEMGADDYLTKPFSPRELTARVKAILRRGRDMENPAEVLSFERLRIDLAKREVLKDGHAVALTPLEFDLLHTLARHCGRVMPRDQLIERVWGFDYHGDERVVDVHVGHIRRKIEDEPARPMLLVTVRGAGYSFRDAPISG